MKFELCLDQNLEEAKDEIIKLRELAASALNDTSKPKDDKSKCRFARPGYEIIKK
jgi:hypothetical protein